MDDEFDLFAACGVEAPRPREPKSPKPEPKRHTEWSNATSFQADGYVARVYRYHCQLCSHTTDVLEGIFSVEIHKPSGTRRLQQLATGGDWPARQEHRKEVTVLEADLCALCVGDLGFSKEVDSKGQPYTLVIPTDRRVR